MDFKLFLLYLVTFVDLFAVGSVVPLVSLRVLNLGGSHFVAGLMGSFYSGLQLFSGPIIGSLSDIKGRKGVFVTTLLCSSVAYLCLGVAESIVVLLCIRVALGIFKHTQTLAKAFVADVADARLHSEIYGKMAAISGAGITLGPLVGGHIMEAFPGRGFSIACVLTFLLFIVNAGLVYTIDDGAMTKSKKPNAQNPTPQSDRPLNLLQIGLNNLSKSLAELRSVDWPQYWDVFVLKALSGFGMSVFYSVYSPLLKSRYGLSPKYIGYTISFQGVVGALCSFFAGRLNERLYREDALYTRRNLHAFSVISLTFLGMLVTQSWSAFVALLVPLAVCNAVLRLITLEMIVQKCAESQRGSLMGASNSVRSMAGIVGPFAAGCVSDWLGVQYVLVVALASSAAGVGVAVKHARVVEEKRREAKSQ